tara:strand:- start:818 stop:979 length:162 start_codon:yes stop_codon:yes gene_type:complete
MDPKKFEARILKVTREAHEAGAKFSEIQQTLLPLISRSRFYRWVDKWREAGLL